MAEIYLAGGCFWGLQEYFRNIPGVLSTEAGYANGDVENPTYEEVCTGMTGHAETVRISYDNEALSLRFLLELFFMAIDPVSVNRQGADEGPQYRTGIYYINQEDFLIIQEALRALQARLSGLVAVDALPLRCFYSAEEYHQFYLKKRPGGYCHIPREKMRQASDARINPALYPVKVQSELKNSLSALSYQVTMQGATEPPFSHPYYRNQERGIYVDITTGEPLFSARDQFDAGCGWPSFYRPIEPMVVKESTDTSLGMLRTEVKSRVGDAHLGHVFEDEPKGGLRYCINGAALRFIPVAEMEKEGYGYLKDKA